jgi:hypothetical protein
VQYPRYTDENLVRGHRAELASDHVRQCISGHIRTRLPDWGSVSVPVLMTLGVCVNRAGTHVADLGFPCVHMGVLVNDVWANVMDTVASSFVSGTWSSFSVCVVLCSCRYRWVWYAFALLAVGSQVPAFEEATSAVALGLANTPCAAASSAVKTTVVVPACDLRPDIAHRSLHLLLYHISYRLLLFVVGVLQRSLLSLVLA